MSYEEKLAAEFRDGGVPCEDIDKVVTAFSLVGKVPKYYCILCRLILRFLFHKILILIGFKHNFVSFITVQLPVK